MTWPHYAWSLIVFQLEQPGIMSPVLGKAKIGRYRGYTFIETSGISEEVLGCR